jgi:2,4-dienoyl-CoA reductase (NADPH2)
LPREPEGLLRDRACPEAACALEAEERGHEVTLFEASDRIGGQLGLAVKIPGKRELAEMLRYFDNRLEKARIDVITSFRARVEDLDLFDAVVVATGVTPRPASFEGIDHPMVASYVDVLSGRRPVGSHVAIIGGGGIAFDVAELLTHGGENDAENVEDFCRLWGIDRTGASAGGLTAPAPMPAARTAYVLQRKPGKPGGRLGKTTGWVLRTRLERRGVELLGGARYLKVDDRGLHVTIMGKPRLLEVSSVVICAGQEAECALFEALLAAGKEVHKVGGASGTSALDAKRAIREGVLAALAL